jgi:shikimate dehydrogenase
MHNNAFRELGLDYVYLPIETGPEHLGEIMNAIRHMNFAGLSVTKPDKMEIIKYLDELDPLAEKIGAVNTVVVKDGKLIGYNTDGEGFIRSLTRNYSKKPEDSVFFCFGAGGSARAVCAALAAYGAKRIYIAALHVESSTALANDINTKFHPICEAVDYKDKERIRQRIGEADVVKNHSGVGMHPYIEDSPVSEDVFRPTHFVFDATYNPAKTKFLKDAEKRGAKTLNGLEMLVIQGALQFKMWTGCEEPIESMFRTVNSALNGKNYSENA